MSDFFVTLPSNASSDVFPENKIHRYTTKLARPIDFGKYKAALVEFKHPGSWMNITEACEIVVNFPQNASTIISLPPGKYVDIPLVIDGIHRELERQNLGDKFRFFWNPIILKTTLQISEEGYQMSLTPTLRRILGFSDRLLVDPISVGEYRADIDEGMTSLFVYSPIIQSQLVGDVLAPLLRTVPLKAGLGTKNISHEFRHPRYLDLVEEVSDLITIDIRRDDGRSIPFLSGKVIATLHFIPK
jgi:hypothetical protein